MGGRWAGIFSGKDDRLVRKAVTLSLWSYSAAGSPKKNSTRQQMIQFLLQQRRVNSFGCTAQAGHHCSCLHFLAGSDQFQQQVALH